MVEMADYKSSALNGLSRDILAVNKANGWDVIEPSDWSENDPPNVDKLMRMLALIHSEASEGVEAVRKGDRDNFVEELADVIIRCLDATAGLGVDIGPVVLAKLEKNRHRGRRHGGKLA